MTIRRLSQHWAVVIASAILVTLGGVNVAGAHDTDPYHYAPSQGDVSGYYNDSGWLAGYNSIISWMIWQSSDRCEPDSKLLDYCGRHEVFEHEVWLSNYRSRYPEEYRWSSYPVAYSTNLPGTTYLDTQESDPAEEVSFTVGTLDVEQLHPWTWYYADITAEPDWPGPNWMKLRIQTGNEDQPGCGIWVSPDWCMLYPHNGFTRIDFSAHQTMPGYVSYGP